MLRTRTYNLLRTIFCTLINFLEVLKMMRDIKKYAHGLSRIYVHMSFKVKYSHEVFEIKEFMESCEECFKSIAEEHDIDMISLGFDANHTHVISDLGKYSEPKLRKIFKGISGHKLLKQFPEIKRKYFWESGLWGRQYYCYSIGSDMRVLQRYIEKQKFFKIAIDQIQTTLQAY